MNRFIPIIGQMWPEQGGIYVGARLISQREYHVIIPGGIFFDITGVKYQNICRAIENRGAIGGFSDWHLPDQNDLMLAYCNVRELFMQTGGADSLYWTRSERYGLPWAVGFENGRVDSFHRGNLFRVRPVRVFADTYF